MITEKEKMIRGDDYLPADPQLASDRMAARKQCKIFNDSSPDAREQRAKILKSLVPAQGQQLYIEPPFYCDYGYNIRLGNQVYMNFNCVILDICPVTIGDNTMLGPAVQIYAAMHPMEFEPRNSGREFGKPVTIGNNVWIGGHATILPGVTIGDGSVIGAGSVVTKNIPPNSFAAGNPARVIRTINQNATP